MRPRRRRPPRLHPRNRRRRRGRRRQRRACGHAFPARAQRLPAHRPRQGDLPRLRHRGRARRALQPALRRHQPGQGGRRVRGLHQGGRALARLRLARPRVLRVGLLRAALSGRRAPDPARAGLRRLALGRRDPRPSRHADRAGHDSPYRSRSVEENLDLFRRMRAGEFPDGAHVLRARIDMASPNINLRDPVLYRIRHASHHRTGDAWCIYPMYDYAHPLSDAFEGVTHSLCTLEYEAHRPLYDWVVRECEHGAPAAADRVRAAQPELHRDEQAQAAAAGRAGPRARLGRPAHADPLRAAAPRLHARVDPRLLHPRRRGQEGERHRHRPARALRPRGPEPPRAAGDGGAAAAEGGAGQLPRGPDRDDGRRQQPRGRRAPAPAKVPFSRELYIERDDFMEDPPKKFFRLAPGREVRLRNAYLITCQRGGQGRRRARSSSCAAPTIRPPGAATRRTAAR